MPLQIFDERAPANAACYIQAAQGLNPVTLRTAGSVGGRIDDVLMSNSDTIAHVIIFGMTIGANPYVIASISVPAGAGSGGTAPVRLFDTQMPVQQAGWVLNPLGVVTAAVEVAVAATKTVTIVALGGDF